MRGLGRYIIARLVATIPMLLVLLTVVFFVLRVMPGDPAQAMLGGKNVPPEVLQELRERLGLNLPLGTQYVHFMLNAVRGNFGYSSQTGNSVFADVAQRVPATLELALAAMLVAIPLGLQSGIWASTRADRPVDHTLRILNIGSFAIFIPWLGMVLQLIFCVALGWLPIGGRLDMLNLYTFNSLTGLYVVDAILRLNLPVLWDAILHLILPAVTLGFVLSGLIGRLTRTSMLEVLGEDYVRTARSKGLPEGNVVYHHALRNALIPIVTVVGLQFALLVGGAILTEVTFSWPGLARYLMEAILARDFNAIQGSVIMIALVVTLVNLVVDVFYGLLDPRVKY